MKNCAKILCLILCGFNYIQATENKTFETGEDIDNQLSRLDKKQLNWEKQRRESERYEANRKVTFHENQIKITLAQAKLKEIEKESALNQGENDFRKCLINNRHSSDLGPSKIPRICEDSAKVLRLLGGSSIVDQLIEDFQK